MKKILVTGAAGFIGMHVVKKLAEEKFDVIGIDNLNDYYEPELKYDRLKAIGIDYTKDRETELYQSSKYNNLYFVKLNICDKEAIANLFKSNSFDVVLNLAAQAGVLYSRENPEIYIKTNIDGFFNILDACKTYSVKDLLYASSSSVYGKNDKYPYSEDDKTDMPLSLYAATKKTDELLAYVYSYTYGMNITGLRFFTVYGPWGRPDMAPFIFTKSILNNIPVKLNNNGEMWRDFTYIDDVVEAICLIIKKSCENEAGYKIYNIGNNHPEKVGALLECIETLLSKKCTPINKELPVGDVIKTHADITPLIKDFNFKPRYKLYDGLKNFIDWYKAYYN